MTKSMRGIKRAVSNEWNYTKQAASTFPEARDFYEGFCPISPERIKGISDFDGIRSATRNYICKHTDDNRITKPLSAMGIDDVANMTDEQVEEFARRVPWAFMRPNDDKYIQNVKDMRAYFMGVAGGLVRPMRGRLALEVDIVVPNEEDKAAKPWLAKKKYDIDNCLKPIQDALDFRTKTSEGKTPDGKWKEGKMLGLVVDDKKIVKIVGTKHVRRNDEELGFYWKLRSMNSAETEQSDINRRLLKKNTTPKQRACAERNASVNHSDKWEESLVRGFSASQRANIRVSLLTTDDTPLDPVIAEHYVALRHLFDRDTAAALVFEEQNRVRYLLALGRDADPVLCEIEDDLEDLENNSGVEVVGIEEPQSVKQLDAMFKN